MPVVAKGAAQEAPEVVAGVLAARGRGAPGLALKHLEIVLFHFN
jgi:hypothetical protein